MDIRETGVTVTTANYISAEFCIQISVIYTMKDKLFNNSNRWFLQKSVISHVHEIGDYSMSDIKFQTRWQVGGGGGGACAGACQKGPPDEIVKDLK